MLEWSWFFGNKKEHPARKGQASLIVGRLPNTSDKKPRLSKACEKVGFFAECSFLDFLRFESGEGQAVNFSLLIIYYQNKSLSRANWGYKAVFSLKF